MDVSKFIPEVLLGRKIEPRKAVLTARFNEKQSGILFKYELTWTEDMDGDSLPFQPTKINLEGLQELSNNKDCTLKCEGACGKYHRPNEMQVVGRCDHYLCKDCASIVLNRDGSNGCSNFDCYRELFGWLPEETVARLYKEYVLARLFFDGEFTPCYGQDESNNSKASEPLLNTLPTEYSRREVDQTAVEVRLCVLDDGPDPGTQTKQFITISTYSNALMIEVLQALVENKCYPNFDKIREGRLFLVHRREKKGRRLIPCPALQWESTQLKDLSSRKHLYLVLDLNGSLCTDGE